MITLSFQRRADAVYIPLRMSIDISLIEEGLQLYPVECRLFTGKPLAKQTRLKLKKLQHQHLFYLRFRILVYGVRVFLHKRPNSK